MLNPVQIALNDVLFHIPNEVLAAVFTPQKYQLSLDECIIKTIIRNKVLQDMNIVAGKLVQIILNTYNAEYCAPPDGLMQTIGGNTSIYRILPAARENRPIVAAVSLRQPFQYGTNSAPYVSNMSGLDYTQLGTNMNDLGLAAINSQTYGNIVSSPIPHLLTGDMIKIDPPYQSYTNWVLECRLAWDEHFTGMEAQMYIPFKKLVYAATRVYIFNKQSMPADQTYLSGGLSLNTMKDFITEGRDFIPQYEEHLQELAGASLLDKTRIRRLISWM